MARRKKRKGRPHGQSPAKRKEGAFNPVFRDLGVLKQKAGPPSHEPLSREKTPPRPGPQSEGNDCFIEAMSDVIPLTQENRRVPKAGTKRARPAHPPNSGDLEVMAHLSDLVTGTADMDIRFSDEYIEGSVRGFDKKLMERLKEGLFSVQDHLDLHGLKKEEAESAVRDFLLRSHRLGLRCVLVVHGKGLNSENHIPVLKKRIPGWLSRGPVRKIVLAFSTARPYHGGTGAIYILLKRPRGRA
ncbi:MAG: Smr/MutS family protein [Deltaproteobacteria bacterium]|nr:Smr/MutS family protein [Deltaproteobacteria bacterium]MBW2049926.1 Smr/MutS family protein [Deltaproteobacteria bacterium]MBW2353864.1 Smr/MutS family protein [Deltaproteobacteria bacterium]